MVTFNDLLSWDGTNLDTTGDALIATSHKYQQVNTNLQEKDLGDGLSGKTFEAEAKARRILADDAEDLWTGLEKAGNDLKDASTTVTTINNAAHNLAARVKEDDLIISKNGEITTDPQSIPSVDPSQQLSLIEGYEGERDRLVEQARDTVAFISSVYDELAKLDDTANGPSPEVVNHGERPPNPKWTPSQVNDWWTSLTDAQRKNIINKHPAWIGNLNGIPMNDRHQANLVWLPIMQAEIDKSVEDYEPKQDPGGFDTPGYKIMLQRQRDIHALSMMFDPDHPERPKGHQLLVLDNTGDHFRAAVGTGDIDKADNVIVYTPGMDTNVEGDVVRRSSDPNSDWTAGSKVQEVDRMVEEAKKVGGGNSAGVMWLGYDAPTTDETATLSEGTAFTPTEAEKSKYDLASFYNGIQETHHGDPHLVAAGHSYGSSVTEFAAEESTAPDDISVWGSPGLNSVDASDMNMLPDHAFAERTDDDLIRYRLFQGTHGPNPMDDPNSDFTTLDTGEHGGLKQSEGHSEYTEEGSTSLRNQGKVLADQRPDYANRRSIG